MKELDPLQKFMITTPIFQMGYRSTDSPHISPGDTAESVVEAGTDGEGTGDKGEPTHTSSSGCHMECHSIKEPVVDSKP